MCRMTRTCPKCKIEKSAEAFGVNRATKDGLTCYCKECMKAPPRIIRCLGCEEDFTYVPTNRNRPRLCPLCKMNNKICSDCHVVLPRKEFRPNAHQKDGLGSYCNSCYTSEKGRRRIRLHNINQRWKLTPEQYDELIAGGCDSCGIQPGWRRLVIDHCHELGYIRGVLCQACNTGIGKLGDNVAGLKRAIEYLERAEAKWMRSESSV